jgi:predicted flap endonuclease-1-like 5' DNA nuclease
MENFLLSAVRQATSIQEQAPTGGLPAWAWFLIVVLIILLVWWLLVRSAEKQSEFQVSHEAEIKPVQKMQSEVAMADSSPNVASKNDDLTLLEGIGPKVNSILAEAGITRFDQLANTKTEHLKGILESAGYRYMDPETWPEQAGLLSEGKMEEFKNLVDNLKGGRRK